MGQAGRKILTMERCLPVASPVAAGRKGSPEAVRRSSLRLVARVEPAAASLPELKTAVEEPERSWAIEVVFAVLALGAALIVWLSVR